MDDQCRVIYNILIVFLFLIALYQLQDYKPRCCKGTTIATSLSVGVAGPCVGPSRADQDSNSTWMYCHSMIQNSWLRMPTKPQNNGTLRLRLLDQFGAAFESWTHQIPGAPMLQLVGPERILIGHKGSGGHQTLVEQHVFYLLWLSWSKWRLEISANQLANVVWRALTVHTSPQITWNHLTAQSFQVEFMKWFLT